MILIKILGPGWEPGGPRLGSREKIPQVEKPVYYYNPEIPFWITCYTLFHFGFLLLLYYEFLVRLDILNQFPFLLSLAWLILSITSFGFLLENRYLPLSHFWF